MAATQRVLVIHNPVAGRGRAAGRIAQLEEALREAGVAYDLARTASPGQAVALAAKASGECYAAIIAAGGDGTINEVINGVAAATPDDRPVGPIGIYSIGTGNDFAHSLKAKAEPDAVVQALRSGKTRAVDLGLAHVRGPSGELRRYFNNSLGFGLEATVTQESDRIHSLSGGTLYLVAAFRGLRSYETPFATIEWLDEGGTSRQMEQEITILSVGNANRTGGAFYLTPDAEVDDGLFDVAIAGALSRARLLALLPRALLGKHTGARSVRMLRCSEIRARSQAPLPVHMDGEVVMADAVETAAVVERGRLEILG